jgi:hypothetical protein
MTYGQYKADEFPLIRGEGAVARCDRSTEESHRVLILQQHGPKSVGRGVIFNDEREREVDEGEDTRRGNGVLQTTRTGAAKIPRSPPAGGFSRFEACSGVPA